MFLPESMGKFAGIPPSGALLPHPGPDSGIPVLPHRARAVLPAGFPGFRLRNAYRFRGRRQIGKNAQSTPGRIAFFYGYHALDFGEELWYNEGKQRFFVTDGSAESTAREQRMISEDSFLSAGRLGTVKFDHRLNCALFIFPKGVIA